MAVSGHTYTFKVTARDLVGNQSWITDTVQTFSVTTYYPFAGQRAAMRRCGGGSCAEAVWLHGDHPSLHSGQASAVSAWRRTRMGSL